MDKKPEIDYTRLYDFLEYFDIVARSEPPKLSAKEWDYITDYYEKNNEIPEEYKDRVTKAGKGLYDTNWERWNYHQATLFRDYFATVSAALVHAVDKDMLAQQRSLLEIIRYILEEKPETNAQENNPIPNLISVIPKKHLIPNNKLANTVTKDVLDTGVFDLIVSQGKNEIKTRCILTYEGDNIKLLSRHPFTEYDRQVADAVASLYVYGDESHIITPSTVFRAMTHATETETPSPQQIGAVTRSLDKLRFIRVKIDCTKELKQRKASVDGAQISSGIIDTYLLALDSTEVSAGGKNLKAYKILRPPILYEYAHAIKQVLTVPAVLLDIRDKSGAKVPNTERRISVKGVLMRRIAIMKGKSKVSNRIMYKSVYDDVCGENPSPKEMRVVREYIPQVLDYWVLQGWIRDYEELLQKRKKIGVEIIL